MGSKDAEEFRNALIDIASHIIKLDSPFGNCLLYITRSYKLPILIKQIEYVALNGQENSLHFRTTIWKRLKLKMSTLNFSGFR